MTPQEAVRIQEQVRAKVTQRGRVGRPRLVAGADAAFEQHSDIVHACVVVLAFPELEPVETVVVKGHVSFPYIPGLLSFREAPALLRAFMKLKHAPDVIFIDGHGLSHPRSAGIACHIGLSLNRPVIGCAKSVLIGTYKDPAPSHGSISYLYDRAGGVIGAAVRTRDNVKPVAVQAQPGKRLWRVN